jgi:hypothetical protein
VVEGVVDAGLEAQLAGWVEGLEAGVAEGVVDARRVAELEGWERCDRNQRNHSTI